MDKSLPKFFLRYKVNEFFRFFLNLVFVSCTFYLFFHLFINLFIYSYIVVGSSGRDIVLFLKVWTLASTWGLERMKTPDASSVAMATAPPSLSVALL